MKLDAWLAQKGGRGSEGSVSKAAAMRRWHRNMSLRDSLVYRWKLYKVTATAMAAGWWMTNARLKLLRMPAGQLQSGRYTPGPARAEATDCGGERFLKKQRLYPACEYIKPRWMNANQKTSASVAGLLK